MSYKTFRKFIKPNLFPLRNVNQILAINLKSGKIFWGFLHIGFAKKFFHILSLLILYYWSLWQGRELPLVAQTVKNLPAMQETWVQSLGLEDSQEKGMATHSSILAWRIPWTEESGRLQSMGWQRVQHDRTTNTLTRQGMLLSPLKRFKYFLTLS